MADATKIPRHSSVRIVNGHPMPFECCDPADVENLEAELARVTDEGKSRDAFIMEFIWGEENPRDYTRLIDKYEVTKADLARVTKERDEAKAWVAKHIDPALARTEEIARLREALLVIREGILSGTACASKATEALAQHGVCRSCGRTDEVLTNLRCPFCQPTEQDQTDETA